MSEKSEMSLREVVSFLKQEGLSEKEMMDVITVLIQSQLEKGEFERSVNVTRNESSDVNLLSNG